MKILKLCMGCLVLMIAPLLLSACGEKADNSTPAAHEHNYTSEEFIQEPTCTEEGLKRLTCPADGEYTEVVVPALGHRYGSPDEVVSPTDLADGLMIRVCERCGDRASDQAVPKLPHTATPLNFNTEVSYVAAAQNAAWYNFSVDETTLFHLTDKTRDEYSWAKYEIFNAGGESFLNDDDIRRWVVGLDESVFSLPAGDYSLRIGTSRYDFGPQLGNGVHYERESSGEVSGTFILNNITDAAPALPVGQQIAETAYDNTGMWYKLTAADETVLPEIISVHNGGNLRRTVYDVHGNEVGTTPDDYHDSVYSLSAGDYYFHISAQPWENNETVTLRIFYGAITLPHLETVDLSELSLNYVWCKFEFRNEHDFINIMAPYNSWHIYKLENNRLVDINLGYNHFFDPKFEITEGIYYIRLNLGGFAEAGVNPEVCYGIKPIQLNETVFTPAAGVPGSDGGDIRKLVLTEDTVFVFDPVGKQRQEAVIVINDGETDVVSLGLNAYHEMVIKLPAGTYFVGTDFSKYEIIETDSGAIRTHIPDSGEFRLLTPEAFITLTPNVAAEGFPEIDEHGRWYKIDITESTDYQFSCGILDGFTGDLWFKIFDENFDKVTVNTDVLGEYNHYTVDGIPLEAGTYYINLYNMSDQYTKASLSVGRYG